MFNIGSGQDISIREVAVQLAAAMERQHIEPEILGKARDRRHPPLLRRHLAGAKPLGFVPRRGFADSLGELADWVDGSRRSTASRRHAASWRREDWSHERHPAGARYRANGPILVTGGAGFIGCNLADRLATRRP